MAIKGPKGSEPRHNGWVNAKTGELLKACKISAADIGEWMTRMGKDINVVATKIEKAIVQPSDHTKDIKLDDGDDLRNVKIRKGTVVTDKDEPLLVRLDKFGSVLTKAFRPAPPVFEEMTKAQMEEYGRTVGLELDRRKSRSSLIKQLEEHVSKS